MKAGAGFEPAKFEIMLVYKNLKTGESKEFSNEEFNRLKIWEDSLTWKWESTNNKLIHSYE